jgi:hypothetical protein
MWKRRGIEQEQIILNELNKYIIIDLSQFILNYLNLYNEAYLDNIKRIYC